MAIKESILIIAQTLTLVTIIGMTETLSVYMNVNVGTYINLAIWASVFYIVAFVLLCFIQVFGKDFKKLVNVNIK